MVAVHHRESASTVVIGGHTQTGRSPWIVGDKACNLRKLNARRQTTIPMLAAGVSWGSFESLSGREVRRSLACRPGVASRDPPSTGGLISSVRNQQLLMPSRRAFER
jgi:hypothetical protein